MFLPAWPPNAGCRNYRWPCEALDRESSEEQQSWAQSIRVSSSVKLKAVATKRGREKEREREEREERASCC